MLVEAVLSWAKELGMNALHGPLGFSDLDPQGILVEGFDQLGNVATLYHYPYYKNHFEQLEFQTECDWVEFKFSLENEYPPILSKINQRARKRLGLTLKEVKTMRELSPWLDDIFDLVNTTYVNHFGFVPLNKQQRDFYLNMFSSLIKASYVPMLVDSEQKLVGFCFSFPSLAVLFQEFNGRLFPFNFLRVLKALSCHDRVELGLVGIHSDYHRKGLPAILMESSFRAFRNYGVCNVETNPELATNISVQSFWKHFNAVQHKRRRCYRKDVV